MRVARVEPNTLITIHSLLPTLRDVDVYGIVEVMFP